MLAALAAVVVVQPGDTLSGIAQAHGESLAAIEAANPQFRADWNLIRVGDKVTVVPGLVSPVPVLEPVTQAPAPAAPAYQAPPAAPAPQQPAQTPASVPAVQGGVSIPGMPQGLANCIWMRESTQGTNPAADGNQFGIIPASGHDVSGDSLAQQEQVAGQIYAQSGGGAWAADGCPGT